MACATVAFTDPRSFAGAVFPDLRAVEDQVYLEPEIASDDSFEGIVGRSPALKNRQEYWCMLAVLQGCLAKK